MAANTKRISEAIRKSVVSQIDRSQLAQLRDARPGQTVNVQFQGRLIPVTK